MVRILIADDHPIVRRGLRDIIAEMPDTIIIDEVDDGRDALSKTRGEDYDVVILDIAMPGSDGIDVLEQMKREKPNCPVLMLSMYSEEQFAVRALRTGAAGYLTKTSAPNELIAAVQKVLSGGRYVSSSLAENLVSHLQETEGQPHEMLSNREFQIMCLIASGRTAAEIAKALSLSVKTISTYRSRILKKTGIENNVELAKYALRHNLVG